MLVFSACVAQRGSRLAGAHTGQRHLMNKTSGQFLWGAFVLSLASVLFTAYPTEAAAQRGTESCIPAPLGEELQPLQGTWEGALVGDQSNGKITITITGASLHFHRDAKFWFKTTFTLPAGAGPKQLHATIKDCAPPLDPIGKVVVALFRIENETLTLVPMGEGADETPKSIEAAEDQGLTRYELRKVQPQKKKAEPPKIK